MIGGMEEARKTYTVTRGDEIMEKHKHKFVSVDVTWKDYWGKIHDDISPIPGHVISACACGAVKLVKARLVGEKENEN